ncbi:DUF4623 domain-containing protein [Sphingobacterium sp. SGG-5]|uniref:DUF4623 domain-containing protein n=1 Tax=Sphingobacterium sp. SGG-5 TaxID=2710881 RepID=UPI0013ED8DA0|nr:DUF4623 domain-containing protein [Sphingobacterium sp. SGG-5]NGM62425.1 DUF4623 domain-containing protein [Sphingobacterium sp. SGG-5]
MKTINYILKSCVLLLTVSSIVACKDKLPEGIDSSDKYTELKSIKLLNAGENGDLVLEGVIDQDKKLVTFPRIDPLTDFSALKFEAVVSDGAVLEQNTYSIQFGEGQTERSIVFKVVNSPRTGEYLSKIALKLPPIGAEFSTPSIYDFTNNPIGNPLYPTYVGQLTRSAGFDGKHVLVVSRQGGTNPHLLKVSDLKQGIINKMDVNTTGMGVGTFAIETGALIGGDMIVTNLSGSWAFGHTLSMYYYEDYETNYNKPPIKTSFNGDGVTQTRFGDNLSYNLDENGNGNIISINNPSPAVILRVSVSNFTQITGAKLLPMPQYTTLNMSYNRVGRTGEYIMTSYDIAMRVMDSEGSILYTDNGTVFPANLSDARVLTFNGARYLLALSVPRTGLLNTTLCLYDITPGKNVVEALEFFAKKDPIDRHPIFEHSFDYTGNSGGAQIARTAWNIIKDDEGNDSILQIFGSLTDAGFAIVEFPKNVQYED